MRSAVDRVFEPRSGQSKDYKIRPVYSEHNIWSLWHLVLELTDTYTFMIFPNTNLTVVQLVSTKIKGIISYLNKMEENNFEMTTPC
jgi:hypothetical protein